MTTLLRAPLVRRSTEPATRGSVRLGEVCLAMACGVCLVAVAYTAARYHQPWAPVVYWAGELLVFAPAVWRLCARRVLAGEAIGLVAAQAIAQYLIKCCYHPAGFAFPDELQHWRTAHDIIVTGHLFAPNYSLPISPHFPGLENATAALVSLTGMALFPAGLLVAGLVRLLTTLGVFLLARRAGAAPRIAALAATLYAASPHYQYFDAIFGYQTFALAFAVLALHAAVGAVDGRGAAWWPVAAVTVATTVAGHHVTGMVLALVAVLLVVVAAATGNATRRLAAFAAGCVAAVALWIGFVAPETIGYLRPAVTGVVQGVRDALSGHGGGAGTAAGPIAGTAINYATVFLIAVALPFGWWRIIRGRRRVLPVTLAVASVSYYPVLALRVLAPDGAELAGRALTYAYIPVGYVLAVAAAWLSLTVVRRNAARVLAAALATLLFAGGITSGWPPAWERLPGRFLVDGFESGMSERGLAAARFASRVLGPGNRIAADFTNYTLLGTYADQDVVAGANHLFYAPRFDPADAALVRRLSIGYVLVDRRTTVPPVPPNGYFPFGTSPAPIPAGALEKFDHVDGVDKIYADGSIIIYDLRGSRYAR